VGSTGGENVGKGSVKRFHEATSTLSYSLPLTLPPRMDVRTLEMNRERSLRISSAASVQQQSISNACINSDLKRNAPLFNGSSAFGSRKRYCRPTMTELRLSTGFQSSRRMFKHTLPSRSTFGWYIWQMQRVSQPCYTYRGLVDNSRFVCT
jgi:hypothetical protein